MSLDIDDDPGIQTDESAYMFKCCECDFVCDSYEKLNTHVSEKYSYAPFQCEICAKAGRPSKFSTDISITAHILDVHGKEEHYYRFYYSKELSEKYQQVQDCLTRSTAEEHLLPQQTMQNTNFTADISKTDAESDIQIYCNGEFLETAQPSSSYAIQHETNGSRDNCGNLVSSPGIMATEEPLVGKEYPTDVSGDLLLEETATDSRNYHSATSSTDGSTPPMYDPISNISLYPDSDVKQKISNSNSDRNDDPAKRQITLDEACTTGGGFCHQIQSQMTTKERSVSAASTHSSSYSADSTASPSWFSSSLMAFKINQDHAETSSLGNESLCAANNERNSLKQTPFKKCSSEMRTNSNGTLIAQRKPNNESFGAISSSGSSSSNISTKKSAQQIVGKATVDRVRQCTPQQYSNHLVKGCGRPRKSQNEVPPYIASENKVECKICHNLVENKQEVLAYHTNIHSKHPLCKCKGCQRSFLGKDCYQEAMLHAKVCFGVSKIADNQDHYWPMLLRDIPECFPIIPEVLAENEPESSVSPSPEPCTSTNQLPHKRRDFSENSRAATPKAVKRPLSSFYQEQPTNSNTNSDASSDESDDMSTKKTSKGRKSSDVASSSASTQNSKKKNGARFSKQCRNAIYGTAWNKKPDVLECKECQSHVSTRFDYLLANHILKNHIQIPAFVCEKCGMRFMEFNDSEPKRHFVINHEGHDINMLQDKRDEIRSVVESECKKLFGKD
ncbi:hypothetical protein DdX_03768 [Ditylenchus destructor]|uniref:Uncharacterized protein n=1 Tax=Ditylenchus destructor TaxID=166010 RepID=A0AAD4ND40_9BILA|nr:hypothetical protein DdX_03768 [Ditylenchus destructor]